MGGRGAHEARKTVEFYNLMKTQIHADREAEVAKEILSLNRDFNLIDAFRLFDISGNNFVQEEELRDGLDALGIAVSEEQLSLFFKRYDVYEEGKIRYQEFCEALKPKDNEYAQKLQ